MLLLLFSSNGGLPNAKHHHREKNLLKLTHYDETKKRAHDSQLVRTKVNLKLSHSRPSQRQASATNQRVEALRQGRHWARGLTHRYVIKEEDIAINQYWVNNHAHAYCRMISMLYPTFYNFQLITKIRLSNNSFKFINYTYFWYGSRHIHVWFS